MNDRGKDVDEFYTVQGQRRTGICVRDRGVEERRLTDLRLTKATLTKIRHDELNQRRGQPLNCNNRNRDEPEFEGTKTWTTFTL